MKMKLIVSLLVICLAFSLGSTQAQTEENETSEEGNLSTDGNISTLDNKMINVSQEPGGDTRWILPGPRRLDPVIFGTPEMPLGFEEEIGVPIENRSISEDGTEFNSTIEDTPYSDNYSLINGSFTLDLTDRTPVDVDESEDTAEAEFNFTDPSGEIEYRVVLTNVTHVGEFHPVLGGVVIDGIAHGRSSIDTRLEPTSYAYGAVWGVGELYINGTLVSNNRVIHAMATERVRSSDEEGYRLLFDNELPHHGIQTHLVMPEKIMADNGTMVDEPVPTNYTLPDGEEQPFIHVAFDEPQLEGLEILNFMNVTDNVTDGNVTDNVTDEDMVNVSFMLESIEGIENNNNTGQMWFVYINGEPAEQDFGMNEVIEGDNLSFWYTTEENGEAAIDGARTVVNISIGEETEITPVPEDLIVLYDDAVNLTEGTFTFTPEGSDQEYELDNFTDIGALNAIGLNFTASEMDNMTDAVADNMTEDADNMTEEIVEVSISNFAFEPASVTISTGDTVRWTNMDSEAHTATGPIFDSGTLEEGDSYEFVFTESGTFEYYCSLHPDMQGNVTVMARNMTGDNEDDDNAGDNDNNM